MSPRVSQARRSLTGGCLLVKRRLRARRLVGSVVMQTFRILYFQEGVLEAAEDIAVPDVLVAIEKASRKPPHQRAEVWTEHRRVAEIGPSPRATVNLGA